MLGASTASKESSLLLLLLGGRGCGSRSGLLGLGGRDGGRGAGSGSGAGESSSGGSDLGGGRSSVLVVEFVGGGFGWIGATCGSAPSDEVRRPEDVERATHR